MINVCMDALQDWFDAINCKESTKVSQRVGHWLELK